MANFLKWARYFFSIDFSTHADVLGALVENDVLDGDEGKALADVLNELDAGEGKGQWTTSAGDFSLDGATVVYNGDSNSDLPVKSTEYNKVLVVLLKQAEDTLDEPRIFLQYNV